VRASVSVAWKNARAKAPYKAGESLVKPAAVKISRMMCNVAVANELPMAFLQTTIRWSNKELPADILKQTVAAAKTR